MVVRALLDYCSVKGVTAVIAEMAQVPKAGIADLEKRCQRVIDELKTINLSNSPNFSKIVY